MSCFVGHPVFGDWRAVAICVPLLTLLTWLLRFFLKNCYSEGVLEGSGAGRAGGGYRYKDN